MKYHNFTLMACQMNEPEEGVAPTDSRLRPDQRMMEIGDWDQANTEKVRLEEKQRAVRRKGEEEAQRVSIITLLTKYVVIPVPATYLCLF